MIRVTTTALRRSVVIMRVLCPLAFAAALALTAFALIEGRPLFAAIDAFCGGVNLMLTWVEWQVFEL